MWTENDMRWFAARLSVAVYDTNQEYRLSLQKDQPMSITGFEPGAIQGRLDALKKNATARRAGSLALLDAADKKVAAVDTAIAGVAAQIEKEAADALAEFATHTNGGPALDDTLRTPLPPPPTIADGEPKKNESAL